MSQNTAKAIAIILGSRINHFPTASINSKFNLHFCLCLGVGAAFFYPAKKAAITNIFKSKQLKFANALTSVIGAIAFLFGTFGVNYLLQFGKLQAFSSSFNILITELAIL